ncbi:Protein of unknown function [Bacillus cereus]|nr:Protein of unknown function [Bacillus cereus]
MKACLTGLQIKEQLALAKANCSTFDQES